MFALFAPWVQGCQIAEPSSQTTAIPQQPRPATNFEKPHDKMTELSTSHPLVWIDCEVCLTQLPQIGELKLIMQRWLA